MPNGSWLRTPHPISKAAMAVLAKHWPAPIPFSDLCAMAAARIGLTGDVDDARTATLGSDVLKSFCAGVVELHRRSARRSLSSPVQGRKRRRSRGCRQPAALM